MHFSTIISCLALLISIGIAIGNYYSTIAQKRFEKKLKVYTSYLKIIAYSVLSPEMQHEHLVIVNHILAKQELILIAPLEIIRLASEIEPINFTKSNKNQESDYQKYLSLLKLMREDLRSTKVNFIFRKKPAHSIIPDEYLSRLLG